MFRFNRLAWSVILGLAVAVAPATPQPVERGKGPEKISASLYGALYSNADVPALAKSHPQLQQLRIGWPGLSDSAMTEVAKLLTLEELDIGNYTVTDMQGTKKQVVLTAAGWKAVAVLPKLHELRVNDVKIDEAGMKEIGKLRQIKTLYLAHNGITDAGVKHLEGM